MRQCHRGSGDERGVDLGNLMKRTIIAFLLLSSMCPAWSADNTGGYFSRGAQSCGAFLDDWKKGQMLGYSAWIAGYITAFNRLEPNTYNIAHQDTQGSLLLWMENYCRQNPLKDLDDGMTQLTLELYPRRQRKSKDN